MRSALQRTKELAEAGKIYNEDWGICQQSEVLIPFSLRLDARELLLELFKQWSDRSDSEYYPVDGWYEARFGTDKWKHPKRLKLLDYLINETGKLQW